MSEGASITHWRVAGVLNISVECGTLILTVHNLGDIFLFPKWGRGEGRDVLARRSREVRCVLGNQGVF